MRSRSFPSNSFTNNSLIEKDETFSKADNVTYFGIIDKFSRFLRLHRLTPNTFANSRCLRPADFRMALIFLLIICRGFCIPVMILAFNRGCGQRHPLRGFLLLSFHIGLIFLTAEQKLAPSLRQLPSLLLPRDLLTLGRRRNTLLFFDQPYRLATCFLKANCLSLYLAEFFYDRFVVHRLLKGADLDALATGPVCP